MAPYTVRVPLAWHVLINGEVSIMKSVRVHYSTPCRGQVGTAHEVSFASLEEAKNALPSGYGTAQIFVEGGSYFYSGRYPGFGWEFHQERPSQRALLSFAYWSSESHSHTEPRPMLRA